MIGDVVKKRYFIYIFTFLSFVLCIFFIQESYAKYLTSTSEKASMNVARWRILVNNKNKYLFKTAREAGVENFGKFNNYGYKGLYNGETAKQIAKRKNIKENEDILDYMGSEELGANLFRITQTEAKLKKDNIDNEDDACLTHYNVGKTVRKAIEELGGNMPETLPTPEKSIKELEKDELQKIGNNQ